ncbi:MAG TPA: hypothetical protein VFV10_16130 [Gammaproteobacteria bacterium]|nr:hypothetical protein [Gammaproteobacteria bacterium]
MPSIRGVRRAVSAPAPVAPTASKGFSPRALAAALGVAAVLGPLACGAQSAPSGWTNESSWTGRTSDGQPSLQGYWTNATVVPLQRPEALGDKAFYTEQEAADYARKRLAPQRTQAGTTADVHYQLEDYALGNSASDIVKNLRTSLVVDPPNGRIPAALPEAAAKARERAEYQRVHAFDSAQDRSLSERCILWSHEIPILPVGYNSSLQIVQSRGYVVVMTEMMPDARIVPLGDRPALPSSVPQWLGDSRGHFEGDTLVVETTNFTGKTAVSGTDRNLVLSPDARVVERFKRIDEKTLLYRFTVDDPKTWTRPWTVEYPMAKIDGPMFEYACQEGNYGLANTLRGARAEEKAAAQAAASGKGAGAEAP